MKKPFFLNGFLKTGNESLGPFAVDLDFDEKLAGYKHKKGILYAVNNKQVMSKLYAFMCSLSSDEEAVFEGKDGNSIIELKGFSPNYIPFSEIGSSEEATAMIRICEFTFQTFIKRVGIIPKGLAPSEILFHIEDMVLFRPTLKGIGPYLNPFDEPKNININLSEFENLLKFEIDDFHFETSCEITGPANKYEVSVATKPILIVKPKLFGLTEDDIIDAGNNLFLLLSFFEERFINYFAVTICYQLKEEKSYAYEFRHTHYSKPMSKPERSDLKFRMPMDNLTSSDIKTAYLSYEHLSNNLKLNFAQVIYLYLNAVEATMIYYPIVNFYSCIEKMLKIGPKTLKDFHYPKEKNENGNTHEKKLILLCSALGINYSDLLSKNHKLEYIQIRNDYTHNILGKRYTYKEIDESIEMVGYLTRRLIFSFLNLDYKKFNSCDPQKRGRIGP